MLIAIWLIALQAFVAGLAMAQNGAAIASDPVVCHGSGDPGDPAAPDSEKFRDLCCAYCMSAVPGVPPPAALSLRPLQPREDSPVEPARFAVIIAPGALPPP